MGIFLGETGSNSVNEECICDTCTADVILGIEPACLALGSQTPVSRFGGKGREHHSVQNS